MKIYRLPNNSLELADGQKLFSLSITPPALKFICQISPAYVPAGKLISRPHKAILYTAITLLKNN
jgi:hypothetical protein